MMRDVPPCDTYSAEHIALQALVDRLFTESGTRVFAILNKYFPRPEFPDIQTRETGIEY